MTNHIKRGLTEFEREFFKHWFAVCFLLTIVLMAITLATEGHL